MNLDYSDAGIHEFAMQQLKDLYEAAISDRKLGDAMRILKMMLEEMRQHKCVANNDCDGVFNKLAQEKMNNLSDSEMNVLLSNLGLVKDKLVAEAKQKLQESTEQPMQAEKVEVQPKTIVGIKVRTKNINEMNPETSKIAPTVQRYQSESMADNISNRSNPGVTVCGYTDYESDENGEYNFFIGEEVNSSDNIPTGMEVFTVPGGKFAKFTTDEGPMPDIVMNAWQEIWQMSETDFGGSRTYKTDFEIYDARARDPANSQVDILVGVES